jgi:hypothetical protein
MTDLGDFGLTTKIEDEMLAKEVFKNLQVLRVIQIKHDIHALKLKWDTEPMFKVIPLDPQLDLVSHK